MIDRVWEVWGVWGVWGREVACNVPTEVWEVWEVWGKITNIFTITM